MPAAGVGQREMRARWPSTMPTSGELTLVRSGAALARRLSVDMTISS